MKNRRGSLVGGVVLILIGLAILAHQLRVSLVPWYYIYPFVFVLLGLASAYRIRGRGHRDGVFGTIFFLSLGAFFILREFDLIPYMHAWPFVAMAIGLGFVAQYFFVPNQWGVLIPGALFLFFGGASLLNELDYWYFFDIVRYWPLILIALGVIVLLNGLRQRA